MYYLVHAAEPGLLVGDAAAEVHPLAPSCLRGRCLLPPCPRSAWPHPLHAGLEGVEDDLGAPGAHKEQHQGTLTWGEHRGQYLASKRRRTRLKDLIGSHRLCLQELKDLFRSKVFHHITTFLEIFG